MTNDFNKEIAYITETLSSEAISIIGENTEKIDVFISLCNKIRENNLPLPRASILRRRNKKGEVLKDLLINSIHEDDLDEFVRIEKEQVEENRKRVGKIRKGTDKDISPEFFSTPAFVE